MMKILPLVLISLSLVYQSNAQSKPEHVFFREEFPEIWQRALEYTLEVAEVMPENEYDFSPVKEQLTFGEHLVHISNNIFRLTGKVILNDESTYQHINFDVSTKKEIIQLLNQAFNFTEKTMLEISDDKLDEEISFGGEKMTKQRIFFLMRDHCTHHRASIITYLRLSGLEPPGYRGW